MSLLLSRSRVTTLLILGTLVAGCTSAGERPQRELRGSDAWRLAHPGESSEVAG